MPPWAVGRNLVDPLEQLGVNAVAQGQPINTVRAMAPRSRARPPQAHRPPSDAYRHDAGAIAVNFFFARSSDVSNMSSSAKKACAKPQCAPCHIIMTSLFTFST